MVGISFLISIGVQPAVYPYRRYPQIGDDETNYADAPIAGFAKSLVLNDVPDGEMAVERPARTNPGASGSRSVRNVAGISLWPGAGKVGPRDYESQLSVISLHNRLRAVPVARKGDRQGSFR